MLGLDQSADDLKPAGESSARMAIGVASSIEQAEKELIRNTLKMTDGNREPGSEIAGYRRENVVSKIKEYGLG